jgi:hypothetical protein
VEFRSGISGKNWGFGDKLAEFFATLIKEQGYN